MGTIDCLFGKREADREEVDKATERDRRQSLTRFRAVAGGALASLEGLVLFTVAIALAVSLIEAGQVEAVTLSSGDLVVADGNLPGLLQIDPMTGAQTTIVSGGGCCGGQSLAFTASGDILATAGSPARVVRVDPTTGVVTTISSGQFFVQPNSVALAANGDILVTDLGADAVIRVNPVTGIQTVVSSGGLFVAPLAWRSPPMATSSLPTLPPSVGVVG